MSSAYLPSSPPCEETNRGLHHIRLRTDHISFHLAYRMLSGCRGSELCEVPGSVFRFPTSHERDFALRLVRKKLGYTIASPFDGIPWVANDPAAQYLWT